MNTNEQNYTKDYSLLRKFDLEMVKCGWDILYNLDGELKDCSYVTHHLNPVEEYIFNIEGHGFIVVGAVCANTHSQTLDYVKMRPLAWVDGKPVYKGDTLYVKEGMHGGLQVTIVDLGPNIQYLTVAFGKVDVAKVEISTLTWNKPKVKREGWINVYKNGTTYLHDTEEDAIKGNVKFRANWEGAPDFVTTVRIEWEE